MGDVEVVRCSTLGRAGYDDVVFNDLDSQARQGKFGASLACKLALHAVMSWQCA